MEKNNSAPDLGPITGTCADCRHAKTHTRPKIMSETGFGDQLMFDDVDEKVYVCNAFMSEANNTLANARGDGFPLNSRNGVRALCEHAGKEIGTVPITCEAWTAGAKAGAGRLAELDAMIAARDARTKGRP